MQHVHKGTPYVYQGEELGMTNTYYSSIEQYQDIESVNYHADAMSLGLEVETVLHSLSVKSRDNARSPMQWDDSSHAGFSEGIPWLSVNPNYVNINAADALADPNSVFRHFQKLIKLRHDHQVLVEGRFELLLPEHEQIWAFTRTLDDQVLVDGRELLVHADDDPGRLAAGCLRRPVAAGHPRRIAPAPTSSPGNRGSI